MQTTNANGLLISDCLHFELVHQRRFVLCWFVHKTTVYCSTAHQHCCIYIRHIIPCRRDAQVICSCTRIICMFSQAQSCSATCNPYSICFSCNKRSRLLSLNIRKSYMHMDSASFANFRATHGVANLFEYEAFAFADEAQVAILDATNSTNERRNFLV